MYAVYGDAVPPFGGVYVPEKSVELSPPGFKACLVPAALEPFTIM